MHGELDERRYGDLFSRMGPNGYRMFAVREPSGEIAAVLGLQILINLYYERHAYVYDLVVSEDARSGGYGWLLMDHAENLARRERGAATSPAVGREKERYASKRAEVMTGRATPCVRAWADIWRPSLSDLVQLA